MIFPATTAFYAGLLGLMYAALSVWVIGGRLGKKVNLGDGGEDSMVRRIRSHANFVEYVPFILILAGLLEMSGTGPVTLNLLLLVTVIARLMHPIGMLAQEASARQFAFRGFGAILTLLVLIVAAFLLLIRFM